MLALSRCSAGAWTAAGEAFWSAAAAAVAATAAAGPVGLLVTGSSPCPAVAGTAAAVAGVVYACRGEEVTPALTVTGVMPACWDGKLTSAGVAAWPAGLSATRETLLAVPSTHPDAALIVCMPDDSPLVSVVISRPAAAEAARTTAELEPRSAGFGSLVACISGSAAPSLLRPFEPALWAASRSAACADEPQATSGSELGDGSALLCVPDDLPVSVALVTISLIS